MAGSIRNLQTPTPSVLQHQYHVLEPPMLQQPDHILKIYWLIVWVIKMMINLIDKAHIWYCDDDQGNSHQEENDLHL